MKEVFDLFDASGDGGVDAEELSGFFGSIGQTISNVFLFLFYQNFINIFFLYIFIIYFFIFSFFNVF